MSEVWKKREKCGGADVDAERLGISKGEDRQYYML